MNCFPLFIDLQNKDVLVIGGGTVALRKIEKLLAFSARVHVIAPNIMSAITALPGVLPLQRSYREEDISTLLPALVIAATNDRSINRRISDTCAQLRIPVNVVDDPALCSFQFPALITEGSLTIGISTGGKSPTAAREMKQRIEAVIPSDIERLLDQMHAYRETMKQTEPDAQKRSELLAQYWHTLTE